MIIVTLAATLIGGILIGMAICAPKMERAKQIIEQFEERTRR